jgi:putative ABC transport system permease protein
MAYYVQQHAKDIGIRLALGGSRSDRFRRVVRQGMTRAMSSLLFGVGAADVPTFDAAAALMTIVAFAACALPAQRAVGVQPASVLRDE